MGRFFGSLLLLCLLPATQVEAQVIVNDFYSPLVAWRQASGLEITPIHIGLLPNGTLFFINEYNFLEHPEVNIAAPGFEPEFVFLMQPTAPGAALPSSVLVTALKNAPPLTPVLDSLANTLRIKTLVCTGHSLMADGNLFFASGADAHIDLTRYNKGDLNGSLTVDGIADSLTLNPDTTAWTVNPSTIVAGPQTGRPLRWYATVTRLADARMLLTGGYEKVVPDMSYNPSVEAFDPAANAWSAISDIHATPLGIENPDYTHVFQFPYLSNENLNIVLMLGGSAEPLFLYLNGPNSYWYRTQNFRPGAKQFIDASAPFKVFPNRRSSTALLPLRLQEAGWGYSNGSVINVGGEHGTVMGSHIDVYDPALDAWRPSVSMHGVRHDPSTVLLPDGRVLILAGYDDESAASQTGHAEYVDPRNGFAVAQGSANMPETRGYHTITVLLPDGRVVVGSGNVDGNDGVERSDFRYYYPDYMFKARPEIVSAPQSIGVGGYFFVAVPHGTGISEAALLGLGAMTHSFDMNQRHVQLRMLDSFPMVCPDGPSPCYDLLVLEAPASAQTAPPGYYMLFVLDANRVPSAGKILKLEAQAAAPCLQSNCALRRR